MGSASHSSYYLLLMLFSFSTFMFFFNSQLIGGSWDLRLAKNVSTGGNADKGMNTPLFTRFRVLLGLDNSNSGRTMHSLEQGLSPVPSPPVGILEDGMSNQVKARARRILIAIVASIGATLVICGFIVVLICHRIQRIQKKRSERTSKVSFDLRPYLSYINSLAPYLESDSSVKETTVSKSILSNESMIQSPSYNGGEFMGCESETVSCLDEEIIPMESSSSDDESFHSICNSHCSGELVSVVSDENPSPPSSTSSPFNSSSPQCCLSHFSPRKSSFSPSSKDLARFILPNSQNSPAASPKSLQDKALQSSCPDDIGDGKVLCFSVSSEPPHVLRTRNSSEFQMTSLAPCSPKCSTLVVKTPPVPSVSESSSITKQSPHKSMPSSLESKSVSSINVNKSIPSPSMRLVSNGNVPKPPPPPPPPPPPALPTPRTPSSQKGCNSSHPNPPPLCHMQSTPTGKDGSPLPKLKPLHWDKVRAASDRSMVWDNIRLSSFELDEEMIESLFRYNLQSSTKSEEVKSKTPSPRKHILEPKRLQNITILFKVLNASTEQVCNAMMQGRVIENIVNGEGLCVQRLEALVKMQPTKEEEDKLSNYEGDGNELGPAERFLKATLNVPFAFHRIEGMLYKENFEDEVVHLKKSFAMLEEACKELRSSRLFLKLLEAVLKTGNRMNVGTNRGGAKAFKLDALLKLADVKGTDGKTTLLLFVVQEMIRSKGLSASGIAIEKTKQKSKPKIDEEKEEDYRIMGLELVSGLSSELSNVRKTASVDLDVLVSSVSNLSNGMDKLKHLVEVDLPTDNKDGSFTQSMKSFLNHSEKIVKELKEEEELVLLHVQETTEYYHGDVSREEGNPLRIFVIVRDFLAMLDRVCKDVRSFKVHQGPNPLVFH